MSEKSWRMTLEPRDGSNQRYGLTFEINGETTPEQWGAMLLNTVESHAWTEANPPTNFKVTILVEGERGSIAEVSQNYSMPTDELSMDATLGYVRNDLSGVIRTHMPLPQNQNGDAALTQ